MGECAFELGFGSADEENMDAGSKPEYGELEQNRQT